MMQIEAYAVVCENDCIADANGDMPDALKSHAEWAFFQAGLDRADIVVLGRNSHEVTPNPKTRKRLVLTSGIGAPVSENEGTVFWNPEAAPIRAALTLFDGASEKLAITGGKQVFDYFLTGEVRYTRFHLSRMTGVHLHDGVKAFSALDEGRQSAESVLRASGYEPVPKQQLDEIASVVTWRR